MYQSKKPLILLFYRLVDSVAHQTVCMGTLILSYTVCLFHTTLHVAGQGLTYKLAAVYINPFGAVK